MAENSVVAFFEPNLLRKEAVLELMAQKKPIIKVMEKIVIMASLGRSSIIMR